MRYKKVEELITQLSEGGVGGGGSGQSVVPVPDPAGFHGVQGPITLPGYNAVSGWFETGAGVSVRSDLTYTEGELDNEKGYYVSFDFEAPTTEDQVSVELSNLEYTISVPLEWLAGPTATDVHPTKTYFMPPNCDIYITQQSGDAKFAPPNLVAALSMSMIPGAADLNIGFTHFPMVFDVPAGYEYQLNGPREFPQVVEYPVGEDPFSSSAVRDIMPGDWITPGNDTVLNRVQVDAPLHWPEIAYANVRRISDQWLSPLGVSAGFQAS